MPASTVIPRRTDRLVQAPRRLGGEAEELLQVLAGDEPPPADLDVGQIAAAHLVIEQVSEQSGQSGGLIDGISQPFAGAWFGLDGFRSGRVSAFPPRRSFPSALA